MFISFICTQITYTKEKPGVKNLIDIQAAITGRSVDEIVASYEGKMYGHLKIETAAIVNEELAPIQKKTSELLSDKGELNRILARGAEKAREKAQITLDRVYDRVGFYRLP